VKQQSNPQMKKDFGLGMPSPYNLDCFTLQKAQSSQ
jgi:hypothetical protein